MTKDVNNIITIAEVVSADDAQNLAFTIAFEKAFTPIFETITGLSFDSSLQNRYPQEIQKFIEISRKLFKKKYDSLLTNGSKVTDINQVKNSIQIINYSEKSIALTGDTKPIKDKFRVDNKWLGRFNRNLNIDGMKQPGWVFPIKHKEYIQSLVSEFISSQNINPFEEENSEEEEKQETLF